MAGWIRTPCVLIALSLVGLCQGTLAVEPAPGKKLYTAKCARCHPFYDPAKYDEERWNTWMEKMRRKAHLNDEQYKQLSEYLRSVRAEASTTLNKREAIR